jgi:glycosyltransferase involved in cell wall biosynthesis
MNIAYLIDTIATDTAGTQKQLLETIRRLHGDLRPQLICLWESPWMRTHALPCPCTVLDYKGFVKPGFPGVVRRLARLIDQGKIDIVQTFFEDSIFVGVLGATLARRRPVLLSSRRDIGLGKGNQPWYHSLFRTALPYVNRSFHGIVANSRQVANHVAARERVPISKLKVIYNGVAMTEAALPRPTPAVFGTHPDDLWIGLVGSLTPVKRHDLLIKAFAQLMAEVPSRAVRLIFLGEGPEHERLAALAHECGIAERLHFEGAVGDVESYLRHLDIGVLCSDREGLSNAILEYMAQGLPVVATDVGGNAELVSAENGLLVPADDANALAGALKQLVMDDAGRRAMGVASRDKARRSFSWDSSMSELESYYRQLLAENAR